MVECSNLVGIISRGRAFECTWPRLSSSTRRRDMVLLPPVLLHLKCSISVYIGNCPPLSRENHCAGLYSFNSCMCVFVFVCWTALGLKARSTESQCSDGVFRKRVLFCCGFLGARHGNEDHTLDSHTFVIESIF